MTETSLSTTEAANGALWGERSQDWAEIQEAGFRGGYLAALDLLAIQPGTRLLDAGCGSGMACQMAAERGAEISGIDAAPALLAIARARVPGGDFRPGDLETLPFADDRFDVVTGFNAFQYAADPVAALAEAARVTRPDGRIIVMSWGDPAQMEAASVIAALKPLLPPPPPGAPGPFALSDETRLRQFASEAGLVALDVIDAESPWTYPDEDTALRGLLSSGVAVKAGQIAGDDAVRKAYADAIRPFRQADATYVIQASCRILLARPAA